MRFSLSIGNRQKVVRQLRAFTPKARTAIKATIGEYAAKEYQMAYDLCPKDTFFMADHIRVAFSRGGYAYRIGWQRRDFEAAGKPGYYFWQEFGFRHHITGQFIQNPCLQPTRRVMGPRFQKALERTIARAVRQTQRSRR